MNDTWKVVRNKDGIMSFDVDGHKMCFFRLHTEDYGYMGMADTPWHYAENKFELGEVINGWWQTVSNAFDKDTANKIYYNATHMSFSFKQFIAALAKEGVIYEHK